jgi:hypothetical protein
MLISSRQSLITVLARRAVAAGHCRLDGIAASRANKAVGSAGFDLDPTMPSSPSRCQYGMRSCAVLNNVSGLYTSVGLRRQIRMS